MLSFLTRRFRHVKFRTKIFCVIGAVALIPITCLFLFFYRQISILQEREITNADLGFEQAVYSINTAMDNVTARALQICSNTEVSTFFSMRAPSKQYVLEYVTALRPYLTFCQEAVSSHVRAIRFYTKNPNIFSNLAVHNLYKYQDEAFFQNVRQSLEGNRAAVLLLEESRIYYGSVQYAAQGSLSLFCPVSTMASSETVMECELNFDSIFQSLDFTTGGFETTGYTLVHKSGQVLFTSDTEWAAQAVDSLLPQLWEGGEISGEVRRQRVRYEDTELLVNAAYIPAIHCVLISHSDLGAIFQPVRAFQLPVLVMLLLCLVFCCFLAAALVNSLLRRSKTINDAILRIQEGDFDICLPAEGADFFDQVAENLNGMAAQIKNLIHNNYESQLEIKDLQIRMLSQQISPHFLYNTLECLRMRAVLEDNLESAQALLSLGKLLRYYANYAMEFASVSAELEVAKDYVNIMSLTEERDCFLEADIPPELLGLRVPRFSLQPIIENSIKHANRPSNTAVHIRLCVEEAEGSLRMTVTDNGMGVPPERAVEIQQKLLSGANAVMVENSIGLYNTNARIQLLYGEEYGILFSSVQGMGTSVTLTIPCIRTTEEGKEATT